MRGDRGGGSVAGGESTAGPGGAGVGGSLRQTAGGGSIGEGAGFPPGVQKPLQARAQGRGGRTCALPHLR